MSAFDDHENIASLFVEARKLVSKLDADPNDDATAEVVLDFCARIGFSSIAEKIKRGKELNEDNRRQLRSHVVSALRVLFGDSEHDPSEAAYSVVLGLPRVDIVPGDTVIITTQSYLNFQVRKLVLDVDEDSAVVHDVKIGKCSILANSEPVPASVFGALSRECMTRKLVICQETLLVNIQNISNQPLDVRGCFLGIDEEMLRRHTLVTQTADLAPRMELLEAREVDLAEVVESLTKDRDLLARRIEMLESAFMKK